MRTKKTVRGFKFGTFNDTYGVQCSIQKSSAACHECIWIGIDKPGVKVMASRYRHVADAVRASDDPEKYNGWVDYPIPQDAVVTSRMHLDQKTVKRLLPILQHFVETGELP
jgi:hypothetical protein